MCTVILVHIVLLALTLISDCTFGNVYISMYTCTCYICHTSITLLTDCVSKQEFDVVKHDIHYWQNVTLSFIKEYVVDCNGTYILWLMMDKYYNL